MFGSATKKNTHFLMAVVSLLKYYMSGAKISNVTQQGGLLLCSISSSYVSSYANTTLERVKNDMRKDSSMRKNAEQKGR